MLKGRGHNKFWGSFLLCLSHIEAGGGGAKSVYTLKGVYV